MKLFLKGLKLGLGVNILLILSLLGYMGVI